MWKVAHIVITVAEASIKMKSLFVEAKPHFISSSETSASSIATRSNIYITKHADIVA